MFTLAQHKLRLRMCIYFLYSLDPAFQSTQLTFIPSYMQANPNALDPFLPRADYSDPMFNECNGNQCYKTYGLHISNSNNVFVYGAGLYSFFDNYDQGCLITENCQQFMIMLENSSAIYLYNQYTKASANVMAIDGVAVVSSQGLQSSFCQGLVYFEEP